MTSIDPIATEWSGPYWDATREHRLLLQRCSSCDTWAATPRPRCAHCWSADLEWTEPELDPRLYSWAIHRGRGENPDRMVALVDALPGLRLLSNLIDVDVSADELQIDDPLELAWLPLPDGRALHQFRPVTTRTEDPS